MARILVVEDQATAQKMIESILQSKGHNVSSAENGMDALDHLSRLPVDLIITDIMMPGGINGFELTRTVRNNPKLSHIPIIMITSRREVKDVEKGIEVGTDDYVVKPIDPDILILKVETLLNSRTKLEQDFASVSMSETATWNVKLKVVRISEMGLTLQSDLPAEKGSKVRIASPIFEEIGLESPNLRVVSCNPVADASVVAFQIELHFIGLSEKALQPLRLWIRNRMVKSS